MIKYKVSADMKKAHPNTEEGIAIPVGTPNFERRLGVDPTLYFVKPIK